MPAKRPHRLLISLSQPQEDWLREESARQALPGGVSELIRRAIDEYRRQQDNLVIPPETVRWRPLGEDE